MFGNFSFTTLSPGWVSIPNSLSLFLSFIFCPISFPREWAAFLGAWCSPPVFRSSFVEVAQHSNDFLMNSWRTKWSPHPIPPLSYRHIAAHGVTKSRARLNNFIFTLHFHALEKEMVTHFSILAWRIPGTEEPSGLPSMGSHRVRHD